MRVCEYVSYSKVDRERERELLLDFQVQLRGILELIQEITRFINLILPSSKEKVNKLTELDEFLLKI